MSKPIVITIDGIDGCGKNTTVNEIHRILTEKNGMKVKRLSFPMYDARTSILIQDMLKGVLDPDKRLSPYTKALMFSLERRIYFEKANSKLLEYDVILMDRSFISNVIYQLATDDGKKICQDNDSLKIFLHELLYSEFDFTNYDSAFIPGYGDYFKFIIYHENFDTNLKMLYDRSKKENRALDENEKNKEYLQSVYDAQFKFQNVFSKEDKYEKDFAISYECEMVKISDAEGKIKTPTEIAEYIINSVYNKLG